MMRRVPGLTSGPVASLDRAAVGLTSSGPISWRDRAAVGLTPCPLSWRDTAAPEEGNAIQRSAACFCQRAWGRAGHGVLRIAGRQWCTFAKLNIEKRK